MRGNNKLAQHPVGQKGGRAVLDQSNRESIAIDSPVQRIAVSVEEAGRMIGIGRTLAYQLAQKGELPTRRVGGRLVVPLEALNSWLAQ